MVGFQHREGLLADGFGAVTSAPDLAQEEIDEQADVPLTLPQGRHVNPDHVESVKQVLPKLFASNGFF